MSPRIPNQFHFVFGLKDPPDTFHLIHYLCVASCIQVMRPERIFFYCKHEPKGRYWEQIRPHVEVERVALVPQVSNFPHGADIHPYVWAHHADFVRLDKVLERGGVYADIDTLFVRPYPAHIYEKPFVLGREAPIRDPRTGLTTPSLCNAVILSEPGASFGRRWRDAMSAAYDGSWSNHSTLLPQRLAEAHPDEIHIEPERSFFPFPPSSEGLLSLLEDQRPLAADTYSLHLWAHLWWSDLRADFTPFHAGQVTEEFVRTVDTTYNVAARRFLPPRRALAPLLDAAEVARRAARSATRWTRDVREDLRNVAKLGVASIAPSRALPRRDEHRRNASHQLLYARARRRFALRNGFDAAILRALIHDDEYGVRDREFHADDVVLDVGAHTGGFSYLCHHLGSRCVHAWEPDPENFALLQRHMRRLSGIHLHERAVFRSDAGARAPRLVHSGYFSSNTGAGTVLCGGRKLAIGTQESVGSAIRHEIESEALDDILARFERVALLKLDCEGSEFPILLTSRLLDRVECIVGEYHEILAPLMNELVPEARIDGTPEWTGELLAQTLEKEGFQVKLKPESARMGTFTAVREA